MSFGPNSTNPRERRAYAHAVRASALANPTSENITHAAEQDEVMARGPKKSQAMGRSRVVRAALDHVFVIDWGMYSEGEDIYTSGRAGRPSERCTGEHLGGHIAPKNVADVRQRDHKAVYGGDYLSVMVGIEHADRITDPRLQVGGTIPLDEALANPALLENGWDIYGDPYPIATNERIRYLTLRQSMAAIIARQSQQS